MFAITSLLFGGGGGGGSPQSAAYGNGDVSVSFSSPSSADGRRGRGGAYTNVSDTGGCAFGGQRGKYRSSSAASGAASRLPPVATTGSDMRPVTAAMVRRALLQGPTTAADRNRMGIAGDHLDTSARQPKAKRQRGAGGGKTPSFVNPFNYAFTSSDGGGLMRSVVLVGSVVAVRRGVPITALGVRGLPLGEAPQGGDEGGGRGSGGRQRRGGGRFSKQLGTVVDSRNAMNDDEGEDGNYYGYDYNASDSPPPYAFTARPPTPLAFGCPPHRDAAIAAEEGGEEDGTAANGGGGGVVTCVDVVTLCDGSGFVDIVIPPSATGGAHGSEQPVLSLPSAPPPPRHHSAVAQHSSSGYGRADLYHDDMEFEEDEEKEVDAYSSAPRRGVGGFSRHSHTQQPPLPPPQRYASAAVAAFLRSIDEEEGGPDVGAADAALQHSTRREGRREEVYGGEDEDGPAAILPDVSQHTAGGGAEILKAALLSSPSNAQKQCNSEEDEDGFEEGTVKKEEKKLSSLLFVDPSGAPIVPHDYLYVVCYPSTELDNEHLRLAASDEGGAGHFGELSVADGPSFPSSYHNNSSSFGTSAPPVAPPPPRLYAASLRVIETHSEAAFHMLSVLLTRQRLLFGPPPPQQSSDGSLSLFPFASSPPNEHFTYA